MGLGRFLQSLLMALLWVGAANTGHAQVTADAGGALDEIPTQPGGYLGPPVTDVTRSSPPDIPEAAAIPADHAEAAKYGEDEPLDKARMLATQNAWRKRVGAPELTWSDEAEAVAAHWAQELADKSCKMSHNSDKTRRKVFGENIYSYWFSRPYTGYRRDEADVADGWGVEIKYYDDVTDTCAAPEGQTCGHYTQMVWSRSLKVGCARARCESAELWVCNYFPRGNIVGVHPYRQVPFRNLATTDAAASASIPAAEISAPSGPAPASPASPAPPLTASGESAGRPPAGLPQ